MAFSKWITRNLWYFRCDKMLRCRRQAAGSFSKERHARSEIAAHNFVQKGRILRQVQNMWNMEPSESPHLQQLGDISGIIFSQSGWDPISPS